MLQKVGNVLGELGVPHLPTVSLTGKEDHGDIDIVISDDHWPKDFTFPGSLGQTSRPGFTHFAYPLESGGYVQVDLIRTPFEYLRQTSVYLSHGTLGNLIGLVCRSIGIRYGMRGLTMIARQPDGTKCGDVPITGSPEECLQLLRLPLDDLERIVNGSFGTREDYYPIVSHLPFFHHDCVHPERMTAPNRGRDKKRPEVLPCREWLLANVEPASWELPWRDASDNGYLDYQFMWQRTLLGEERHVELLLAAAVVAAEARSRKLVVTEKDIWFRKLNELMPSGAKSGAYVRNLTTVAQQTMEAFIETNTPEEAFSKIQTTYLNQDDST